MIFMKRDRAEVVRNKVINRLPVSALNTTNFEDQWRRALITGERIEPIRRRNLVPEVKAPDMVTIQWKKIEESNLGARSFERVQLTDCGIEIQNNSGEAFEASPIDISLGGLGVWVNREANIGVGQKVLAIVRPEGSNEGHFVVRCMHMSDEGKKVRVGFQFVDLSEERHLNWVKALIKVMHFNS